MIWTKKRSAPRSCPLGPSSPALPSAWDGSHRLPQRLSAPAVKPAQGAWRAPGDPWCCERCWRSLHRPGPSRGGEAGQPRSLEPLRGQAVLGRGPEHGRLGWPSPPWSPAELRHSKRPLTDWTLPTRCDPTPSGSGPSGSALQRSGRGGPGASPESRPGTQPHRFPVGNSDMWSCLRCATH